MLGAATKAMRTHRRGAATTQIAPRRRNPWAQAASRGFALASVGARGAPGAGWEVERRRAPRTGSCGRMRRCSSATMLLHRLPPRALPAPRKPPARDPPHYSDRLLGVTWLGAAAF